MQLRVARLCLDCEELYVGSSCPVCASDRYAFLSRWLPTEERRRWRRPPPEAPVGARRHVHALKRFVANMFSDGEPERQPGPPMTRASDFVPRLEFEEPVKQSPSQPALDRQPIKDR